MLWAIQVIDIENSGDIREKALPSHREYFGKREDVIFFSGALQVDDASKNVGSLYLVNFPDRAGAESFINNEPFFLAGMVKEHRIFRLRKGKFNASLVDQT